jgi:hypothetical protein
LRLTACDPSDVEDQECEEAADSCDHVATLETVASGALDDARKVHSGRDVDFAEDVAQVSLDRLLAEEQLGCDLGVRLPVDDQARDLQLTRGQSFEPARAGLAAWCSVVDAVAELAQLALGLCTPP